jgi:hypothetical protein
VVDAFDLGSDLGPLVVIADTIARSLACIAAQGRREHQDAEHALQV